MEFNKAVNIIIKYEGGFVDNPNDPGGKTKYGISKRAYPHLEIEKLTIDQAKNIYYRDYWARNGIHLLSRDIRFPVFDCCVNQGPNFAIKALQHTVRTKPDGIVGPITSKATLDYIDKKRMIYQFMEYRLSKYMSLKSFEYFGKGWMRRLLDVCVRNEYK